MASLVPEPAAAHTFRAGQRLGILPVLLIISADALVITLYVWLVSVGTWIHWPGEWHVYDDLAAAFRHGELAVAERPDPALLALPNPYDPAARAGIPYPRDLSLFRGRFYVYFGPVPALILAPIKAVVPGTIGDQYLAVPFVAGILLLESWLIAGFWRRFFGQSPPWLLVPAILAIGLVSPWPWILSSPSVHDVAITGGVFFLLASLAAAVSTFHGHMPCPLRLILVATLCMAAVGTRLTLAAPAALLLLAIAWRLTVQYRRSGAVRQALPSLLSLAIPIIAGSAALAWYNVARFGSPVDTGFRYALAASPVYAHAGELFSPMYALQNLYNYSLTPFTLKHPFPYFNPARGEVQSIVPFIRLPAIYLAQEMSGLVYAAPFAVLSLVPVAGLFGKRRSSRPESSVQAFPRLLIITLAGWFLCSFAVILAYFWAAERFFAEFAPPLLLLSAIGYFQLDGTLAKWPGGRNTLRIVTSLVVLGSVVTSILVSMSFNSDGFRHLSPVLWRALSNLFRP